MNCQLTDEEYALVLDFKRDMHMYPELSRQEYETTKKIRAFLEAAGGFEVLPVPAPTGLVARLTGTLKGPEIMLRADIDALPQSEVFESPWKSRVPNVMHACGHDFHTAALLGAALCLKRAKAEGLLKGCVDFVFQPAEEGTTGARTLIDARLFDFIHPEACFGMHNWPSLTTGTVACHEGALMSAKRNFEILIHGSGGHGSMPHLNIDPIVCSSALIMALQTVVSRNISPMENVVLSINMIEGGRPANVVADLVTIKGTVRSLSDAALDRAIDRVKTLVENTALAYECTSEIHWEERIPTVFNTARMRAIAEKCALAAGCQLTDAVPSLASEDFALYRQFAPAFFYWVGSTAPGDAPEDLHRPAFHTDDAALYHAAAIYAASVMEYHD